MRWQPSKAAAANRQGRAAGHGDIMTPPGMERARPASMLPATMAGKRTPQEPASGREQAPECFVRPTV